MVGQKYGIQKKVFIFFCPHMFLPKQDRSRLPCYYRTMKTARTTFLSSAFLAICDLRTARFIESRPRDHDIRKTIYRNLDALDCSSVCVISETVTISEPVHASITKALRRIKLHRRVPNRIGERSFLANVGYLFVFLL